jgi:hypothetical protein
MPKKYQFTIVIVAIIVLYLGWIYFSRWSDRRAYIKKMEAQREAQEQPISDFYGTGSVNIVMFYAPKPIISPGETAQLCYGVSTGTEKVRIEPPVENVYPAISNCVDVSPTDDTTYKLIAEDAAGKKKTAEVLIQVQKDS